jgi:ribosomal protein L6P/L9E
MSRIGKLPITLPKGVTLAADQNLLTKKPPIAQKKPQKTPEDHV